MRLRLGAEKRVRSEEELLTIPNVRVVPVPQPVPAVREGLEPCACGLANPRHLPAADLYVFSSPGRIGKPKGNARRFLRKVTLEPGTRYAILTTQGAPRPDKKSGKLPTQEEQDRWERVIPIMNELLEANGMTKVAEGAVLVTGIKGPLEQGWQNKVTAFADQIMSTAGIQPG